MKFTKNSISKNIFDIFSNDDKRIILETFETPNTITNVLHKCDIKKTSGYKMIHELIEKGFITKYDADSNHYTHDIKFISIFKKIKI